MSFELEGKGTLLMLFGVLAGFFAFGTTKWMAIPILLFGVLIDFMIPEKRYKKDKLNEKEKRDV